MCKHTHTKIGWANTEHSSNKTNPYRKTSVQKTYEKINSFFSFSFCAGACVQKFICLVVVVGLAFSHLFFSRYISLVCFCIGEFIFWCFTLPLFGKFIMYKNWKCRERYCVSLVKKCSEPNNFCSMTVKPINDSLTPYFLSWFWLFFTEKNVILIDLPTKTVIEWKWFTSLDGFSFSFIFFPISTYEQCQAHRNRP